MLNLTVKRIKKTEGTEDKIERQRARYTTFLK